MFALQASLEIALYTTDVPDASVIPTATRKFIRLRKLTDKSTSLWSMPTLLVQFWFTSETRFVRIAFLCWAKARVVTSRRYLWPGYSRYGSHYLPYVKCRLLEAHLALNILFHCKPPVITACYSMIISMFISRQKRDCQSLMLWSRKVRRLCDRLTISFRDLTRSKLWDGRRVGSVTGQSAAEVHSHNAYSCPSKTFIHERRNSNVFFLVVNLN